MSTSQNPCMGPWLPLPNEGFLKNLPCGNYVMSAGDSKVVDPKVKALLMDVAKDMDKWINNPEEEPTDGRDPRYEVVCTTLEQLILSTYSRYAKVNGAYKAANNELILDMTPAMELRRTPTSSFDVLPERSPVEDESACCNSSLQRSESSVQRFSESMDHEALKRREEEDESVEATVVHEARLEDASTSSPQRRAHSEQISIDSQESPGGSSEMSSPQPRANSEQISTDSLESLDGPSEMSSPQRRASSEQISTESQESLDGPSEMSSPRRRGKSEEISAESQESLGGSSEMSSPQRRASSEQISTDSLESLGGSSEMSSPQPRAHSEQISIDSQESIDGSSEMSSPQRSESSIESFTGPIDDKLFYKCVKNLVFHKEQLKLLGSSNSSSEREDGLAQICADSLETNAPSSVTSSSHWDDSSVQARCDSRESGELLSVTLSPQRSNYSGRVSREYQECASDSPSLYRNEPLVRIRSNSEEYQELTSGNSSPQSSEASVFLWGQTREYPDYESSENLSGHRREPVGLNLPPQSSESAVRLEPGPREELYLTPCINSFGQRRYFSAQNQAQPAEDQNFTYFNPSSRWGQSAARVSGGSLDYQHLAPPVNSFSQRRYFSAQNEAQSPESSESSIRLEPGSREETPCVDSLGQRYFSVRNRTQSAEDQTTTCVSPPPQYGQPSARVSGGSRVYQCLSPTVNSFGQRRDSSVPNWAEESESQEYPSTTWTPHMNYTYVPSSEPPESQQFNEPARPTTSYEISQEEESTYRERRVHYTWSDRQCSNAVSSEITQISHRRSVAIKHKLSSAATEEYNGHLCPRLHAMVQSLEERTRQKPVLRLKKLRLCEGTTRVILQDSKIAKQIRFEYMDDSTDDEL